MNDFSKYLKLIDRAKLNLMQLNTEINEAVPTAGTDGLRIVYNPDFLDTLNNDEILALVLHEVEHVVNGHCDHAMYPEDKYCPDKLNIAQDHYINLRLKAIGYKLPEPHLADPQYAGLSSMEIYHKLPNNVPKMDPKLKDVLPCPEDMSKEEHARKVLNTIVKGVIMAEQAGDPGSIPGGLRKNLDDIISPKLPWQTILQQYLTEHVNEDYSMRRPNRRFMPNWYLPTLHGEGMGHLVMYCDVSGSMWGVIEEIWSEFKYIFDIMKPSSAHVMTGDTQIQLDKTYDMGDELDEWELTGGGGTNIQPVVDAIVEEDPTFALVFTDGYFSVPDLSQINTQVFWIIKDNKQFKPEKGIVIPFE
jgi:predicted metal-dependent peptidase